MRERRKKYMSAIHTNSSIAKTKDFTFKILFYMFRLVNLGLNAIILHVETVEVIMM
jgi:hypothetical protein